MARLLVHEAGNEPEPFALSPDRPTVIGRSMECQLRLDDNGCSRQHCRIELRDDHWVLRDLDSKNGTHVDGEPVQHYILSDGDIISLANSWLVFHLSTEETGELTDSGTAPSIPAYRPESPTRESRESGGKRRRAIPPDEEETISPPESPDANVLVGSSPVLMATMEQVRNVAVTDTTVLIRGESGVGKELVARAIHQHSPRYSPNKQRQFVSINCAALTESLLESELFGHERGAFTGAYAQKKGKFELSHGGTLFLDEIGEMSPSIQAKFLRVLEGHSFERVGGHEVLNFDVRIIAATNADLEIAVQRGHFRTDLYFRLNVLSIEVPPLRSRVEDIPQLAEHFLEKFARRAGRPTPKLSDDALKRLSHYHWPGNIRELRNMLERAIVLHRTDRIETEHLRFVELNLSTDDASFEGMSIEAMEFQHILRTLRATQWNKSRAAKILGIERSTLDRKLKRYDVRRPDGEPSSFGVATP